MLFQSGSGDLMHRMVWLVTCVAFAVTSISACTSKAGQVRTSEKAAREASATAEAAVKKMGQGRASSSPSVISTVPTPAPPRFLQNEVRFAVGPDGRGQALARFIPPMSASHSRPGWSRIARFEVDQTQVDGVWVERMTFSARITEDTIITRQEQKSFGSGKFPTVSRRVGDIVRADPKWAGPTPGAYVTLEFMRGRKGVVIRTIRETDGVLKSVRLPDVVRVYEKKPSDGVLAAAFDKTGAYAASIVGYVVDFKPRPQPKNGAWIREFVIDKDGERYVRVGGHHRPYAAFGHPPAARVEPESAAEGSARERAVAVAMKAVGAESGPTDAAVYAYVVRVSIFDGTSGDIIVGNDGSVGYEPGHRYVPQLTLQPFKALVRR